MHLFSKPTTMVTADEALPGRDETHARSRTRTRCSATRSRRRSPRASSRPSSAWAASGAPSASSGSAPGVYTTAVGYAGGFTPNPTYEEVCSGRTGHTEAVLVVFDPQQTSYDEILRLFWENHDPTQGMRQGNDVGHAVPVGDLHDRRGAARRCRGVARALPGGAGEGRATARSRPRSPRPGRSTTPSPTTSSTSRRTRTATAGSAAPASPAPSGSRPQR